MERHNNNRKMEEKRGLKSKLLSFPKNKFLMLSLIFVVTSLVVVFAGDFIIREGDLEVDTNVLFVNSTSDRVGIGTTSPGEILSILPSRTTTFSASDHTTWADIFVRNNVNTNGSAAGIGFIIKNEDHINAAAGIAAIRSTVGDRGADLAFITRPDSAAAAERMRILDSGEVGIGTISPAEKLDISGGNIIFDNSKKIISYKGDGTTKRDLLTIDGSNNVILSSDSSANTLIRGLEVGIGTTSPTHKLNVVGDTNVTGTVYYGSLVAQSPHMFEADESGYTRSCWYDVQGFWNLVWFDNGELKIEVNSVRCSDKFDKIEEVRVARETCENSGLLFNAADLSCYEHIVEENSTDEDISP